ncbi:hypothetical protein MRS44_003751 [Fusarium solani]|uniref:uncharacterized protein n=1 Tax=Fusarium solani TaxID=169388 RepID=UPI0032C4670B|nr:hypothetical protein MRS44_003751 [Fusarium solani]
MRNSTVLAVLAVLALLPTSLASVSSTIIRNSRDPELNSTLDAVSFTNEAWIDVGYVDNATWIAPQGDIWFWMGWRQRRKASTPSHRRYCLVPPGIVHWHGADECSYMMHFAAAYGATEWLEEVSAEEYAAKSDK